MTAKFSDSVLTWFDQHGRKDLPWQKNISAYSVWLSEIMLQQTQVKTVIPYFNRFIKKFPEVKKLAETNLDNVLTLWSGLGYYARARNLHKTAQIITNKYQGKFPDSLAQLQSLPGIGRSTAGAILSLGFNQYAVILDGNVKRVLCRYYAINQWPGKSATTDTLWEIAEENTPKERTANYNQAMMDLGAMICTRSQPKCTDCPLRTTCKAYLQGNPQDYPVRKIAKKIPTRTTMMLLLINEKNEILLEKRPPVGIWGGLLSFPECSHHDDIKNWCVEKYAVHIDEPVIWPEIRHTFTHFHLEITPVLVKVIEYHFAVMEPSNLIWCKLNKAKTKELPAPIKKLLEQLKSRLV